MKRILVVLAAGFAILFLAGCSLSLLRAPAPLITPILLSLPYAGSSSPVPAATPTPGIPAATPTFSLPAATPGLVASTATSGLLPTANTGGILPGVAFRTICCHSGRIWSCPEYPFRLWGR